MTFWRPRSGYRVYHVRVDGIRRAFHHRGSKADLGVIHQHFETKELDLSRLRRGAEIKSCYEKIVDAGQIPIILDCGANIGASAVHFAAEFPGARIVCFEPDEANHRLLEMNTAGLNVHAIRSAVGAQNGSASLLDPNEGEWGYRVAEDPSGAIQVAGLDSFVAQLNVDQIPFIAKIDIEGGEAALFEHSTSWVDEFPLVIVELHDWLLPRGGTSRSFLRAIADRDRDFVYIGEDVFSIKN